MDEVQERKILIVDDEEPVVFFMKNYFRRRNFRPLVATAGREAVEVFKGNRPEIVFLDINMEDMDGYEVLKEIRKIDPQAKVVMLTGVKDREAKQKSTRLGASGFINKPIVMEEFEAVLRTLIPWEG